MVGRHVQQLTEPHMCTCTHAQEGASYLQSGLLALSTDLVKKTMASFPPSRRTNMTALIAMVSGTLHGEKMEAGGKLQLNQSLVGAEGAWVRMHAGMECLWARAQVQVQPLLV